MRLTLGQFGVLTERVNRVSNSQKTDPATVLLAFETCLFIDPLTKDLEVYRGVNYKD